MLEEKEEKFVHINSYRHMHIFFAIIPAINIIYIDIIYYNNGCLIVKYVSCFLCLSHDICIIHLNFLLQQRSNPPLCSLLQTDKFVLGFAQYKKVEYFTVHLSHCSDAVKRHRDQVISYERKLN